MTTHLILATAGHIDHGKTSLIRALTGVDADRLPDEQRRGITIDLGFAELDVGDYRLGIVDVPGHERFIRNMLAGATGTDLALLVVAADDSVKPQTREHLEILRLLKIEAGVIALTKCDLAEDDWIELVEQEVQELVQGTFLEEAPLVHTSTETGDGLEQLKAALCQAARRAAESEKIRSMQSPFRMAIDRTFTISGHGTVVTGSISSGQVSVGDNLSIEPGNISVRVRGLQNHDRSVEQVSRGQRAAINLAGVHHTAITRGHELAAPGYLKPSRRVTASLKMLQSAPRALKNRSKIRVHLGTAELLATVRLLDCDLLQPGKTAKVQLLLRGPCATCWAQPYVLRSESPVVTIGGGQILDPNAEPIRRPSPQQLEKIDELGSSNVLVRAAAAYYFSGLRNWHPETLSFAAGVHDVDTVYSQLVEQQKVIEIDMSPGKLLRIHHVVFESFQQRIEETLRKMHAQSPLRSKIERAKLLSHFAYLRNNTLVVSAVEQMQADKRVQITEHGISLAGCGPQLSANEQKLLRQLIERFKQAGFKPPSVKECQQAANKLERSVPALLELAVADGELVAIGKDLFLHTETERQLHEQLKNSLENGQGLTVSEIREILNTTRKYAVPLLEHLDRIGFTRREGDVRVLVNNPYTPESP